MEKSTHDDFGSRAAEQRNQIAQALDQISRSSDPIFRELALARLADMRAEAQALCRGEIIFQNTETWRAAYEKLLSSLDFSLYRSVAWVRTADYWRDQPGRRSIRLNYDLLDRGLAIERVLILAPELWGQGTPFPNASIRTWIEEQHYRGISLSLVREQDLAGEPDLLRDFGIYGERATGEQELDKQSRTKRFRLDFSEEAITQATDRWNRLQIFSISCLQAIDLS